MERKIRERKGNRSRKRSFLNFKLRRENFFSSQILKRESLTSVRYNRLQVVPKEFDGRSTEPEKTIRPRNFLRNFRQRPKRKLDSNLII